MIISTTTYGRIGLGDWSCVTPNGNRINNFSEQTLYLSNNTQLDGLDEWYFYKDQIIGKLHGADPKRKVYFVVNELSFEINTFSTKQEWISYLDKQNLQPKIWTRWFQRDWTFFDDQIILWLVFTSYISLPLMICFLIFLFKAIRKEKLNLRQPYTMIVTITTTFILVFWIFDKFPQSI